MLIATAVPVLARALEPLMTDEVQVQAIRAIVAILPLLISRTNGRAKLAAGDDRSIRDLFGERR